MFELIEQLLGHVRAMWRYRWYAMLLAWVIVLMGWTYIYQLPDQYEAEARVYVDTDSLLKPLLRGLAVQPNLRQRVDVMTRTLLSRPNLEKVARMTDLDLSAKSPKQMESLLDALKNKITLSSTRREKDLYTIGYRNRDPDLAKRVVQSVLTVFVEGSLGQSRQESNTAQKFLREQILDYEQRLIEAENRLAEFKRKNVGLMPGSGSDYYGRLQEAQEDLRQAQLQLREALNRRRELERLMQDTEAEEESYSLFSAAPGATGSLTTSVDARIQALQIKLDEMLLRYTDQHPDVMEIKRALKALQDQREVELQTLSQTVTSKSDTNPLYQQRKLMLDQAAANVAAIQARVADADQRVAELSERIDTTPQVEAELKRLNRDYEVNKRNYDSLLSRLESAKMADEVEQTGEQVQFRVVEPPRVPLDPSGPNRVLLSAAVFFVALGVAAALAFILSQLRPLIFDQRTLRKLTDFPVFGSVSRVWTPELLFKRRLELGAFASASAMLVLAFIGVIWIFAATPGLRNVLKGFGNLL